MFKSVMKEICIMIILAIAILAVMGVLFYEYIPASKTLPTLEAYKTPENVMKEIDEGVLDESTIVQTYRMDETEIKISKKQGDYKAGKQDPFSDYMTQNTASATNTSSSGSGSSSSGSSGTGSSQSGTSEGGSSNQGGYLPDRGTK